MSTLVVPLKDLVLELDQPVDLTALAPEEAIALIRKSFAFLSTAVEVSLENGIVNINLPEENTQRAEEALKWYRNGVREAEQGKYKRAISLFTRVLERLPAHADAQRNLAMAYMESGELDKAKDHLILVLKLDPKDAWSYVLLGNLYSKYEKDFEKAEKWYRRAYELNPKDPTLLTNYGALMVHRGQQEQAAEFFERAMEASPQYPNSYYALAVLEMDAGKPERARQILEELFAKARPTDVRSGPLYAECRKLYGTANRGEAEESFNQLMEAVEALKQKLEGETGYPIEIVEDNSLDTISAVSQAAWKHHRDRHVIRYRNRQRAMTPHLLGHELVHIVLEDAARKAGRNRLFTTDERTHAIALRSIQDDLRTFRNLGMPGDRVSELADRLISGLANQLMNIPLDMIIEWRLFHEQPVLRPSQYVSLRTFAEENLRVLTDKDIRRLTPSRMYRASNTINCAYALFIDSLYDGKTEYAKPYQSSDYLNAGTKLFELWKDNERDFQPGDEYDLVDEYARFLKLQDWFEWRPDLGKELPAQDEESDLSSSPQGPTNPELLKEKEPATVMYLLDTLQRFERLSDDEIRKIGTEVGIRGMEGIDYSSPEKKYSLSAFPGDMFSGLQMLCFMYVAFKRIDPTVNTGLDFDAAYANALKLYRAQ